MTSVFLRRIVYWALTINQVTQVLFVYNLSYFSCQTCGSRSLLLHVKEQAWIIKQLIQGHTVRTQASGLAFKEVLPFFFDFLDRVSLCEPSCPGTQLCRPDWDRSASASGLLGLMTCTTTTQLLFSFIKSSYLSLFLITYILKANNDSYGISFSSNSICTFLCHIRPR